jgi:hypothetical protein
MLLMVVEGFCSKKAQRFFPATFEGSFEYTKHFEKKAQGTALIQLCALQSSSGRDC